MKEDDKIKSITLPISNYSDAARQRTADILEDLAGLVRSGVGVKSGGIYIPKWTNREFKMEVDISFFMGGEK